MSRPCNGQLIYIPDDNFEQKLIELGYDDELNDLSILVRQGGKERECAVLSLDTDQAVKLAHTILKQVL